MKKLSNYFNDIFTVTEATSEPPQKINRSHESYQVFLGIKKSPLTIRVNLIMPVDENSNDVSSVELLISELENRGISSRNSVFVFSTVNVEQYSKLISNSIRFIAYNSLYLPELGIVLSKTPFSPLKHNKKNISNTTQQVILSMLDWLYDLPITGDPHIKKDELVFTSTTDLSETLSKYNITDSANTLGRVFDEFKETGIGNNFKKGINHIERHVSLSTENITKMLNLLTSPVKASFPLPVESGDFFFRKYATNTYRDTKNSRVVYAGEMTSTNFKIFKHAITNEQEHGIDYKLGDFQVWKYNPSIFASGDFLKDVHKYIQTQDDELLHELVDKIDNRLKRIESFSS